MRQENKDSVSVGLSPNQLPDDGNIAGPQTTLFSNEGLNQEYTIEILPKLQM